MQPPADPGAAPDGTVAAGEHELRQAIEQTREQLGQTVEQLAAKADVKARARAQAAELPGRVKGGTAQVRAKAAQRAAGMCSQVAGTTVAARHKATAAGGTAKTQLQSRAAPAWEAAPEPLRCTVVKGARTARQRRVPLAGAAATLVAGYLALRWRRKR
jgi:uncharacterized protein DUF3618